MEFSLNGLLVLFHVLFATLWFGGAAYQVSVIGQTLRAAGPQAGGFMMALAKRGGIGKYFALNGGLAILFGGILYGREMNDGSIPGAFQDRGLWLTLGAIVAVIAYVKGMVFNLPLERKWLAFTKTIQGTPTPEQGKQMMEYGMKLGKLGALSAALVGLAMLLMLLSRVFV